MIPAWAGSRARRANSRPQPSSNISTMKSALPAAFSLRLLSLWPKDAGEAKKLIEKAEEVKKQKENRQPQL